MAIKKHILAIDQGTTSTRSVLFDAAGHICDSSQQEFKQYFPADGQVEHDTEEIWQTVKKTCQDVIVKVGASAIAAIGITNQRETVVVWDRHSGKAIHPAIVWQDRRTADTCAELKRQGHEARVTEKTGLLLDPYFSATKLAWILDHVDNARSMAEQGRLAFGTIDCFLLWRLSKGKIHATDATNASRTLLFNIHSQQWDQELLQLFAIPASVLPAVEDCSHHYGNTDPELFGQAIAISGIAGDQHAAAIGQACFQPGMVKSTYGTGCFVLLNTGSKAIASSNRLLTTVAYRLQGKVCYALEGSIFVAGAAVQWLRDGIKLINAAPDTAQLAVRHDSNRGLVFVPALTGLGAPWWNPEARGAVFGITRDTDVADLARATLEAVCYQTADLLQAMADDFQQGISALRVDGGMVSNDWLLQFLSDILQVTVDRPEITETTALGAAYLAGLQCGFYHSIEDVSSNWQLNQRFEPRMQQQSKERLLQNWAKAVACVQQFAEP